MNDFFSFEAISGEYALLGRDVENGVPVSVYGLTDGEKYLIASAIKNRVVYVTADSLSAQRAAKAIRALSCKKCACLAAKDEVFAYRAALSKEAVFRRVNALYEWMSGADVLVTDIEAALQLVPSRIEVLRFQVGKEADVGALATRLVQMGYARENTIETKGAFAVRGDILDVFPINLEHPVRVDFFGDEVETIKPYDEITGERLPTIQKVEIAAATDVFYEEGEEEKVEGILHKELKKQTSTASYTRFQSISEEVIRRGAADDFVFPLLNRARSLFSVVGDAVVVFDECKLIRDHLAGLYSERDDRLKQLIAAGEAASFSYGQYVPQEQLLEETSRLRTVSLSAFLCDPYFFKPLQMRKFVSTPPRKYLNSASDLITDIKVWLKTDYRVILCCGTKERADRMTETLSENSVPVRALPQSLVGFRGVAVVPDELESGFLLHESKLAVIGTGEMYLKTAAARRLKRRRGDFFAAPEVGDYAVHETYGVGKITGIKKIETTDGVKEYIALEYKDGDTLYVPAEQMDILSKYIGEQNPALSKIGGGEFERVKARVAASLKKMSFDLKALYAERKEKKGIPFSSFREEMDEFIAAFPYEDTPDQAASYEEVVADLCSDKVMDRLLLGDVGFGKTEVAFRAVYLCVLNNKQAALMCPSTVLSEQHFKTATERMKEFGVRIACLNRFRTEREQTEILTALKSGKIDFIIGTHRLLSSDVAFSDLGLLILDEEQRFGVEHKEKIKNYKRDVNCLTMTATPIPRTLHLSLSGIRDISSIQTPPQDRLPVQTYVAEETEALIRDACLKEMARGGQIFILYNRVESIADFTSRLKKILPEAKITFAHGRMDRNALDDNVFGFYRGEFDILVTTTIIENGIDLPNANTLIVIDSDRLGVSQLYQLRGRVGRGKRLAHAYFTYKPEHMMTSGAAERLKAIMQFTSLGSGYQIAMRDLEIRGAGNVLGAEQHGHMDKVGYELYSKILQEEITGVKQGAVDLDIRISAFIPDKYVESDAGRMDCYKQIAEIKNVDDYKRVCTSMEDTYGQLPQETLNLVVIALCKSYAAKFGAVKISVNPKGGALEFSSIQDLNSQKLSAAMEKYSAFTWLDMTSAPVIRFGKCANGAKTLLQMTKFLKFASTFA